MSLICKEHRFIYLKTRKTGSTSVQVGLSKVCSTHDHIGFMTTPATDYQKQGKPLTSIRGKSHNYPEAIEKAFPEEWKTYRKVVCIRNPFTAAVSLAFHEGLKEIGKVRKWIKEHPHWLDMETFVYQDGNLITERIIKFENFIPSYQAVCLDLGFPPPLLPHLRQKKSPILRSFIEEVIDTPSYKIIKNQHERLLKDFYPEISPKNIWPS